MSRQREIEWYKHEANSDSNPKIRRAGFWGARLFEVLLRIDSEFAQRGRVAPHYCDPEYLADRLMVAKIMAPEAASELVAKTIDEMCAAPEMWALIRREEDGRLAILGRLRAAEEEEASRPMSNTERSQLLRARRKIEKLEARLQELEASLPRSDDATARNAGNVAPVAATEATLPLKRRGEEKREEEIMISSNSAAAEPDPGGDEQRRRGALLRPVGSRTFGPGHLVDLWNELAHPAMPRVRDLTGGRRRKIETRLREHPDPGWWREVIEAANASPHCRGESKPAAGANRPWRCTLDFLVDNDTNALKVLEGVYGDDREAAPGEPPRRKRYG